jgi:hypothetical protein
MMGVADHFRDLDLALGGVVVKRTRIAATEGKNIGKFPVRDESENRSSPIHSASACSPVEMPVSAQGQSATELRAVEVIEDLQRNRRGSAKNSLAAETDQCKQESNRPMDAVKNRDCPDGLHVSKIMIPA